MRTTATTRCLLKLSLSRRPNSWLTDVSNQPCSCNGGLTFHANSRALSQRSPGFEGHGADERLSEHPAPHRPAAGQPSPGRVPRSRVHDSTPMPCRGTRSPQQSLSAGNAAPTQWSTRVRETPIATVRATSIPKSFRYSYGQQLNLATVSS